jgi:WhiB family transcriptional regulator, redox-sensing transcriptional regulator
MTVQASWREDAACRGADPDLFFPVGTTGPALRQVQEAKRICRACPAQIPCLAWALDNAVADGVWGGTAEDERRVIRSLPATKTTGQEDDDDPSNLPAERGGFAREFATADGRRVMVAALTRQQFADLAKTATLTRTFAFLERLLPADFSDGRDLYTHRDTIAALLAPWFSRRTVAELTAAFAGTSVPWACSGSRLNSESASARSAPQRRRPRR